ncbi:MAG TPA: tetratricopeptide repeat protein, partial [Burkholderiales bacterium]|nr:tetratricopeptide repeat protein [Burkholderiales bacterium]
MGKDVDGFVAICKALASDPNRLAEMRKTLRERVTHSPLRDEAGFTKALEDRYVEMWHARLKGETVATLDADTIHALFQRAENHRKSGRPAEAGELYKEILQDSPDHIEALTAIWDLSFETGNPGSAVDWLNKAISTRGDVASFHYMLGCSLQARGNMHDAIGSFSRALELDPRWGKAHNNLGCTVESTGDLVRALECYRRAVEFDPKLAVAHYNQGNAYRQLGELVQAIHCIRQALAIDPGHADWRCNLGDLLFDRLQLDEALSSYQMAVELDPGYAVALAGLGRVLQVLGRPGEAESKFRKAIGLKPDLATASSGLLVSLHYSRRADPQAILDEHKAWDARHARTGGWWAARTEDERHAQGRLRIGYLSPDFCRHPVASFIEPVLRAHDRARVQVFCYSNVAHPDEVTRRLEGLCDHWRDISGSSDEQVSERIRYDGIDILVDLAGHTGGGRLELFARKPAPVQVTWLGYPDTTGLRAMDYRLTDAFADPMQVTDRFHTEKLVRLANGFLCYQPPADVPEPGEPPSLRTGRVTFGSFNNLAKVTASMVEIWAQLLHRMPNTKLLIKAFGLSADSAKQALEARFADHGIPAERLTLLPPESSTRSHLSRYHDIDIALDSFPYNGTTTTCEALWMGVPVISLAGNDHASRVGVSLLNRVGLSDLVTHNPDEYLAKAVELAQDAARLGELRGGMRQRLRASPLLDAPGF